MAKSFDIFVRRRLIQSDLLIVNLPQRNDITAYSWLIIDSRVHDIMPEKLLRFAENSGGIVVDAEIAEALKTIYETPDSSVMTVGVDAEFQVLFTMQPEKNAIAIAHELTEISNKYESVSGRVNIGVSDGVVLIPLKSLGRWNNGIELNAQVSTAVEMFESANAGLQVSAQIDHILSQINEVMDNAIEIGLSIDSLSYLKYIGYTMSALYIGAAVTDVDLYRSMGRVVPRIVIDADARLTAVLPIDGESGLTIQTEASVIPYPTIRPETGIEITCSGGAILRLLRELGEIDALDTLGNIDDMTLDELSYTIYEE